MSIFGSSLKKRFTVTLFLYIWVSETILSKVKEAGFSVSLSNETHLTKEMAEQLYGEHRDKEYFDDLTNMMTK